MPKGGIIFLNFSWVTSLEVALVVGSNQSSRVICLVDLVSSSSGIVPSNLSWSQQEPRIAKLEFLRSIREVRIGIRIKKGGV